MFFNLANRNSTTIYDFIQSTNGQDWNYLKALGLAKGNMETATHAQILSNPGDIADGVNKVEMKFDSIFFGIFDGFVVKHRDDGSTQLMFFATVHDSSVVSRMFALLKTSLGAGMRADHKFCDFNIDNINAVVTGQASKKSEELVHLWIKDKFSFALDYKIQPPHQLLFRVQYSPLSQRDESPRTNGTLIKLLNHDVPKLLCLPEKHKEIQNETDGQVKFIDYTYELEPPELGIFERVRIRIFGNERVFNSAIQTHITYFSRYEVDTSRAIELCDSLRRIYGTDDNGSAELQPHEVDMIDNSESWTGRKWTFNTEHGLMDLQNSQQRMMYMLQVSTTPNQDGLDLSIIAFDKMFDFNELLTTAN